MIEVCPVCRLDIKLFAKFREYIIYKCQNCGLGFTSNLSPHFGSYHGDDSYVEEEELFRNIFLKRVKKILQFKKKGSALEIGCSTGLMLSLLKDKGFNVEGVEISKKAARMAQKRGIDVIIKPFEEIFFKKKYDLIIFNHTLEHLKNPFQALEKSQKILIKNGLLYIDLPNFDSLSASFLKKKWPYLLPDEHLWHFTEKSLKLLFNKLNLKIVYVEKSSGILNLDNPYLELWQSFFNLKKRFITNLATLPTAILFSKMDLGDDLLIIAKKDEK